ncbi:MAG: QueT transporter family protein [Bacilli bacterium]
MTRKNIIKDLSSIAIICAMYVALTVGIAPLSYGPLQFRISEALILLCFYNKKYGYSISLGCLIANCFSPLGWVDIVFGTLSTILPCIFICLSKRLFIASLWPTLFVGLIVGAELSIVYEIPFFITVLEVAVGEFVCVTIIGYPLFKGLENNNALMELIGSTRKSEPSKLSSLQLISYALTCVSAVMFFTIPLVYVDEETTLTIFDILLNKSIPVFYLFYLLVALPLITSIINSFNLKSIGFVINIVLCTLSLGLLITLITLTSKSYSILYWFIIYGFVLLGNLVLLIFSYIKNNKKDLQENI